MMSNLDKHDKECGNKSYWCSKGIATCTKCNKRFYEKGGKELKQKGEL